MSRRAFSPLLAGYVGQAITALIRAGAHTAVKYVTPESVVRVTRMMYRGKFCPGNRAEFLVTLGRPNFAARQFIKAARKAGEPFPVRKVQLTFPPKRK